MRTTRLALLALATCSCAAVLGIDGDVLEPDVAAEGGPPPDPSAFAYVLGSIAIRQGERATATLDVTRPPGRDDEILVSFGEPQDKVGVVGGERSLPAGSTRLAFELEAAPDAPLGNRTLTLSVRPVGASTATTLTAPVTVTAASIDRSYGDGGVVTIPLDGGGILGDLRANAAGGVDAVLFDRLTVRVVGVDPGGQLEAAPKLTATLPGGGAGEVVTQAFFDTAARLVVTTALRVGRVLPGGDFDPAFDGDGLANGGYSRLHAVAGDRVYLVADGFVDPDPPYRQSVAEIRADKLEFSELEGRALAIAPIANRGFVMTRARGGFADELAFHPEAAGPSDAGVFVKLPAETRGVGTHGERIYVTFGSQPPHIAAFEPSAGAGVLAGNFGDGGVAALEPLSNPAMSVRVEPSDRGVLVVDEAANRVRCVLLDPAGNVRTDLGAGGVVDLPGHGDGATVLRTTPSGIHYGFTDRARGVVGITRFVP